MNIYGYIVKTFNVMSFSMLCSFLGTILLGNILSIESFGFFNILKTFLPMLSIFVLMGIDKSYIKNYSKKKENNIIFYLLSSTLIFSIIVSIIFSLIFDFINLIVYIFLIVFCGSLNLFLSSYFRMKNQYGFGQIMQSGHKIIFLIIVLLFYLSDFQINENSLIFILLLSAFFPSLIFVKYIYSIITYKFKLIEFYDYVSLYKFGFLFFLLNILNHCIFNMEKFVIPVVYGNEAMGIYSALSFVYITVFTMIGTSMGLVIFPELSKNNYIDFFKISKYCSLIILVLVILFYFFGFELNSFIYSAKYDSWRTKSIDILIIMIGSLQFINGLMHWYILGAYGKKEFLLYGKLIFLS